LKASGIRGGEVSNIYIRDTAVDLARDSVWIQTNYALYGASAGVFPPHFTKVFIDNFTVDRSFGCVANVQGLPEKKINHVYFNNVTIRTAGGDATATFIDTEKIFASNFWIPSAPSEPPPKSGDAPEPPPLVLWNGGEGPVPPGVCP